ncbi:hypothetical protein FRC07_004125 [Ceratobasidium sp. 392]|nr:hypothetical protein FRC07_004125 [Ceratobasidium sp. 392]
MPLEYPVTREYTIPHLTAYLSLVSVIAISAFTVLNVILQGYDVVTVLRPDPNATESYWWSTRSLSLRSAGSCDPVSLPKKMTFNTNSSLFSYEELRSAFDANKQNIAGASSYMANPLSSCTVDGTVVDIDLSRRTYRFDTPILCTGSELPFSLSLVSTFSISQYNPFYDDIMVYYTQNKPGFDNLGFGRRHIQRNASSRANIIGILDAVSADLMVALWLVGNASTEAVPTAISTGGYLVCPGGQNATCKPEEMRMRIPASLLSYPNGSYASSDGIGTFLEPIETTFLNMFTVLQDAYHIDLGNIKPYNTLLSKDAFSARIHPDPALSDTAHNVPGFRLCSSGIGCIYNTTWVDQLLASDTGIDVTVPSILPTGDAPAVGQR